MIEQFMSRQFFAFLVTGGVAAIVNFASRILYNLWIDFSIAIVLAYITGMVTAFVLAKMFVFKTSQQTLQRSAVFFVVVNIFAVLQTWLVSMGMAYYVLPSLGIATYVREIAHACGVVVPVFTSYIGHKHWSFR